MQVIENNELFSELSNEESAEMNGGAGALPGAVALAGFLAANGPAGGPGGPGTITPAQGVVTIAVTAA